MSRTSAGRVLPSGRLDCPLVRRAIDVLIGLVLLAGAAVPSDPRPSGFVFPDDIEVAPIAVALGLAVVLAWRRRWPVQVFVVTLVASVVMVVTGHSIYGYLMGLAVAVYEIARQGRRMLAVGAALLSVVAVGAFVLRVPSGDQQFLRFIGLVATIGFAAAIGDAIQSRRSYVESLTEQIRLAKESKEQEAQRRVVEERLRIARELHDAAAHQVAVINLQAGAASAALNSDRRADAQDALAAIRSSAQSVLGEISTLLLVLRTEGDNEIRPPARGLGDVKDLVTGFERAGLRVEVDGPPSLPDAPESVSIVAYKVIQEALTNAHKHGRDGRALLQLSFVDDQLCITVTNLVADRSDLTRSGHGLIGIKERVSAVGGEVRVVTRDGSFTLRVKIPVRLPEGA